MHKGVAFFCFFLFSTCLVGQTVSFTYKSTTNSYCNPDTIQFTQTSTGNPVGYIWDFGNKRFSHAANPSVIYTSPGTFTVKLLVIYQQGTVQATNIVVINPTIDPSFSYDKNSLCKPGTINFTAIGNGAAISYDWDFGDGTPVLNTASKIINHFYATYGNFKVTLTVNGVGGCISSSTNNITVQKPAIDATVSATKGCIPVIINFNATVSVLPGDGISSYLWTYGDGSPSVSTLVNNTSHSYNTTGKFLPDLVVTTTNGCSNNFTFDSLAFGIPPTSLIAYPKKNVICGSETAEFVGKATNATSYIWNNSETIDEVNDTISTHKYATLGNKKIIVTPSFNGCLGKKDSFNINVIGVIAKFEFKNFCTDKKTFSFTNRSLGNKSSIVWDFGDSSPQDNSVNVTHSYADTGSYVVSLTVSDIITGCSDTYTQKVSIATPILSNPDRAVCRNSTTSFTVSDIYPGVASKYAWYVVGKSPGQGSKNILDIKADLFGNFNNYVVITNGSQYCPDTVYLDHKILVKGPVTNFTSQDTMCLNTSLNVTNTSRPYIPGENIVQWNWNFKDGSIPDTSFQPQPHEYSNPGVYPVTLTATDINGCTDIFFKAITVAEDAFIYILPKTDTLCQGQSKTLIAYQSDSIMWSPANFVSCVNCDTVLVNPNKTTTFYATSTSAFGCTAKDSALVKVYLPFTATTPASDLYICLGESAQLEADPAGYKVIWSPPNALSDPNVYNPAASPLVTTTYTATLNDSVGCFSSSVDVIVHLKTLPTVDAGPDKFYPYNSAFTISPVYSNNVVSYLWTPSKQLNCTTCSSPSGTATQKEVYTIAVTSDSGCVSKDEVTIYVECKDANLLLPTAFTPNNDNLNDVYYPLTRGVNTILNFSIYSREGQLIYQKRNFPPNDKSYGWNGTFKGQEPSTAVYVYTIEALCDSGERLNKKGSFVLIR